MADYSRFLFDSLSGVGDTIAGNRRERRLAEFQDRDFARQLDLDRDALADRERVQGNADRSYALDLMEFERGPTGGTLPPYRVTPEGNYEPVPGGPQDPAVVERLAKARSTATRLRTLPQNALKALGDVGSGVADVSRVANSFEDEYSGYGFEVAGDAANFAARNFGVGNTDAAEWWQDYQSQKNIRRNQLFGSALTKTEAGEFAKADINPGMTPQTIRKNLERQSMIARRAAAKLAAAYTLQGHEADVIEGAIGIPLSELGVEVPENGAERRQGTQPAYGSRAEADAAGGNALEADQGEIDAEGLIAEANEAIAQGADPNAVRARLQEMGIDLQ